MKNPIEMSYWFVKLANERFEEICGGELISINQIVVATMYDDQIVFHSFEDEILAMRFVGDQYLSGIPTCYINIIYHNRYPNTFY